VDAVLLLQELGPTDAGLVPLPPDLLGKLLKERLPVLTLHPDWTGAAGACTLRLASPESPAAGPLPSPTQRSDFALMLFTSGSTGRKRMVPYTLETLIVGAVCVGASWGLSESDVCLNSMPLFHAGGLIRNLLGPLLSGGSAILLPGFDPESFWESMAAGGATWYYASPTIHSAVLAHYEQLGGASSRLAAAASRVRLVGNAAGPLLPSLALQLRGAFGPKCAVLPSYGCTECMPISSPPLDYALERPGTSGRACGPELGIFSVSERTQPTLPGVEEQVVAVPSAMLPVAVMVRTPVLLLQMMHIAHLITLLLLYHRF
jgi:acyl-CoA synthetase (AMP-forming)/AMP-acid ligase II